jgi:hypothetical protein
MRFQRLDEAAAEATAVRLQARISSRFPDRNLVLVAGEVVAAFSRVQGIVHRQRQLMFMKRVCTGLATLLVAVAVGAVALLLIDAAENGLPDRTSWLGLIESGINDFVFAGIAAVFLFSAPARWERRLIQAELHRLRSLAHVVDMHQLTKDPDLALSHAPATSVSPTRDLNAAELGRYLDYCSELLSLISKNAALYAQISTDPVVLEQVSDIEQLTVGLSRKVWQKISLLHR